MGLVGDLNPLLKALVGAAAVLEWAKRNPYVGPRSFKLDERLFGRERETNEFIDLLLAERVVLLHSQSGAGKTSLIHAAVLPRLRDEGFDVLPTVRVSRPPLPGAQLEGANRYVMSALTDLASGTDTPHDPAKTSLDAYFATRLAPPQLKPSVVIFDQFEELLTLDATDLPAKLEFCRQLGLVLADRSRWAIFAMREEFIGGLAPYVHLFPTRLTNRYRLELLSPDAAREAIRRPAEQAKVQYDDTAVDRLVDDLRRVRQQTAENTVEELLGPVVEPVHLQVVCTNLWMRLPPGTQRIQDRHVADVGTVDSALGAYYAKAMEAAAKEGACDERALRQYVAQALIINGVRAQALAGQEEKQNVTGAAMAALEARYVIRRDPRRGGIWYELAHDRMIGPIVHDNARWKDETDPVIFKLAEEWDRNGRPTRLLPLLQPEKTVKAFLDLQRLRERDGSEHDRLPPVVRDYLKAGSRFQRNVFVGLIFLLVVVAGITYGATTWQENNELKRALARERALRDSVIQAVDSATRVSTVFYQKAWGLEDTSRSKVQASVAINQTLQRVVRSGGTSNRRDITINYFAKRSDAQRVEFALKELGFSVVSKPAFAEDIATNAVSYGPEVPATELRIIALAIARTGAQLRRICPFRTIRAREHTLEIIGAASAARLPPLTPRQLETLEVTRGVQCTGGPVSAR